MKAQEKIEAALQRGDEWSKLTEVVMSNICGNGYDAYERAEAIMEAFCRMCRRREREQNEKRND